MSKQGSNVNIHIYSDFKFFYIILIFTNKAESKCKVCENILDQI